MAFSRTVAHATAADGTFSAAGAAAWDGVGAHTPAVTDATSGGIPYFSSTTAEACSALLAQYGVVIGGGAGTAPFTDGTNLLYTTASGPRLQVGSGGGASAGLIMGYSGASGYGDLWSTAVGTLTQSNYLLAGNGSDLLLNAPITSGTIYFSHSNTARMSLPGTAGSGPAITAGTATTNVAALSVTRTNNNAAVETGVKFAFTDTTSAAGFLPFQVLGGASATTNLLSVGKGGTVTLNTSPTITWPSGSNLTLGGDGNSGVIFKGWNTQTAGQPLVWNLEFSSGVIKFLANGYSGAVNTESADGRLSFYTSASGTAGGTATSLEQLRILNIASANRYITLAGSNGGNPTIGVSAGSLAITPATVFASSVDAVSYKVGGAAGADFGPGVVTSITVVKGIITAIS